MTDAITSFDGEHAFLSNFFICPNGVSFGEFRWRSSEHAFAFAKIPPWQGRTQNEFFETWNSATPGQAKRAGRKLALRSDWEQVKVGFMLEILTSKFKENPALAEKLKATGNRELVEGNTWGQNLLGELLMVVRKELQNAAV